jgi:hypothetical protein
MPKLSNYGDNEELNNIFNRETDRSRAMTEIVCDYLDTVESEESAETYGLKKGAAIELLINIAAHTGESMYEVIGMLHEAAIAYRSTYTMGTTTEE